MGVLIVDMMDTTRNAAGRRMGEYWATFSTITGMAGCIGSRGYRMSKDMSLSAKLSSSLKMAAQNRKFAAIPQGEVLAAASDAEG